ncbi:MAG: PaaI family thioesterase [Bacillati bacterium ANGP1]|uniref:Acyl-coenzyme A thioesterase THEM4 n=1 Tax=Candidatus Segetimicrobium genomatis TaxID=2569760 RepID=A0A537LFI3_9BACT|nr:MAG: PaaI family thioesterase [Terrabacteria group bacterium ANGP1]
MRAANRCFVCGQDNPIGLKLKFVRAGEGVRAEFTPSDFHAGYEGLVHGGILAALIDDAMANVWFARGQEAVTAKIEIRFRQEAKPGDRLLVSAEPAGSKGGLRIARATVTRADGALVAEGSGFVSIK